MVVDEIPKGGGRRVYRDKSTRREPITAVALCFSLLRQGIELC